ncbi:hypothetical protein TRVA0_006S03092 [Trichomonascus vanleenenianus]|uniref:uncharacterized protein n=1 Tax=Trichomonascus vanleenenianus TaxID=2268995 RepID=UPI003EC9A415
MWPSSGNGVTLSYGHDGMGLYLANMTPNEPWHFARSHGKGYRFYDIGAIDTLIPSLNYSPERGVYSSKHKIYRSLKQSSASGIYIPSELMAELNYESFNALSSTGHDPIIGRLMGIGSLKSRGTKQHKAIGMVDANSGGTGLSFSLLNTLKTNMATSEEDTYDRLNVPFLDETIAIDLGSKIHQIAFARPSHMLAAHPFSLARTTSGIHVVKLSNTKGLSASVEAVIAPRSHTKGSRADQVYGSLNPHRASEFATIDSVGSWTIYSLSESEFVPIEFGAPHLSHSQHRSRWNRVLWQEDENNLMVANRAHARLFDRRSLASIDLLNARSRNAQIFDIAESPSSDYENLILTSNQLIWTDRRVPGKTLLAWDHFLHSEDASLQMTACTVDNVNVVTLFSQLLQPNIVYQFTQGTGLPISAEDPYYFLSSPDLVTQCMEMFPLEYDSTDSVLCSMRYTTGYGLVRQLLSTNADSRLVSDIKETRRFSRRNSELYDLNDHTMEITPVNREVFYYDFTAITKSLFASSDIVPPFDAADSIQVYGRELAAAINNLFKNQHRGIYSLLELRQPAVLFSDLGEVTNMIEQLREHYEHSKIDVFPLTYNLNTLFEESVKGVTDIHDLVTSLWVKPLSGDVDENIRTNREKLARHVAIDLSLACMGVHSSAGENEPPQDIDSEENQAGETQTCVRDYISDLAAFTDGIINTKQLKPTTKLLLSEWEDDQTLSQYEWFRFDGDISQRQERKKRMQEEKEQAEKQRQRIEELHSQPLSSQFAMSQPLTQIQSQHPQSQKSQVAPSQRRLASQKKRKKARKEGFA